MPAVSINRQTFPPSSTCSSTGSLVVPARSFTTALSEPTALFRSEDLPTFGRPIIATRRGPPNSCLATAETSGRTAITLSNRSATPLPCRAETGCGSPNPRDQREAASASMRSSSTLFARRNTGLLLARSIFTTRSSVAVGPTVASTTKQTASESSTAISACKATDLSIPLASGSQPPVSTSVYLRPFHSALYETRSLVTPGLSSTTASLLPMILFTSADLPTLGLPTIAKTGRAGRRTGIPSAAPSCSRT